MNYLSNQHAPIVGKMLHKLERTLHHLENASGQKMQRAHPESREMTQAFGHVKTLSELRARLDAVAGTISFSEKILPFTQLGPRADHAGSYPAAARARIPPSQAWAAPHLPELGRPTRFQHKKFSSGRHCQLQIFFVDFAGGGKRPHPFVHARPVLFGRLEQKLDGPFFLFGNGRRQLRV